MSMLYLAALLGLDLMTKHWVEANMMLYQTHVVLPGLLQFTFVHNTGAAFSLLPGRLVLFQVFTVIALLALCAYAWWSRKDRITFYLLITAIAGALGNFYDRMRFGHVRDFIDVPFFAVFNVADIYIVVGMILLAIRIVLEESRDKKARENPDGTL